MRMVLRRLVGMKYNAAIALLVGVWPAYRVADGTPGHTGGIFVVLVKLFLWWRRVLPRSTLDCMVGDLFSHQNVLPRTNNVASSGVKRPSTINCWTAAMASWSSWHSQVLFQQNGWSAVCKSSCSSTGITGIRLSP